MCIRDRWKLFTRYPPSADRVVYTEHPRYPIHPAKDTPSLLPHRGKLPLAVERVQAGESPEDIIRTLGFTRSCIYTWLALYRAGGWGALRARALKGRPMRIQPQQMSWLYRTITGKSPLQY